MTRILQILCAMTGHGLIWCEQRYLDTDGRTLVYPHHCTRCDKTWDTKYDLGR